MRILVGGVHLGGEGYPNARNTLDALHRELGIEVVECGTWLPPERRLWRLARSGVLSRIKGVTELLLGNLASLWRVCRVMRPDDWVYVPHPGLFFLWFASWMPRGVRPRCIVDAYISVWDTVVNDRGKVVPGLRDRMLLSFEGRAWRAAEHVIVDTTANRAHFSDAFSLDPGRVHAWPLAIDEPAFGHSSPTVDAPPRIRVLYVGTFVPLHGIAHLADLARSLSALPSVELVIVGDGQEAHVLEIASVTSNARVRWIRDWQSREQIAHWIAQSDICLGVFGGSGKASRVLPLKLYHYFSQGRAVVSQSNLSVPEGAGAPPIHSIDPEEPRALVEAIRHLAADPVSRAQLAQRAATYYRDHLSRQAVVRYWSRLLDR